MNFAGESIVTLAANPQVEINRLDILANAAAIAVNTADISINEADIAAIRSVPDSGVMGVNPDTSATLLTGQIANITKAGVKQALWIQGIGNVAPPNQEYNLRNSTTNIFFQSNNPGVLGSYFLIHRPMDDTSTITYRITYDCAITVNGLAGPDTAVVQSNVDLLLSTGPTYETGPIAVEIMTVASNVLDAHFEYEYTIDYSMQAPASDAYFIPVVSVNSAAVGNLDVITIDARDGSRQNRLKVEVVKVV